MGRAPPDCEIVVDVILVLVGAVMGLLLIVGGIDWLIHG